MKKLTLFLFALLISCSAWGAKIYLKPSSDWKQSNARFAAYFFGNGEKWVSMTWVPWDNEVCYCEMPTGYTKVIFCRMNPGNTANNWNNKWNQTGDLNIPNNGNNMFENKQGTWDGATSSWSKYTEYTVYTLDRDKEIYYTNDKDWKNNFQFIVGRKANKNDYSTAYMMAKIDNTNLYYYKTTEKWENYNEWSVFHTTVNWVGEDHSVSHRKDYSEDKSVGIGNTELSDCNLLSYDGKATTLTNYESLNNTQTINVTTDGDASIKGGSITASTYYLSGANTASASTPSTSDAKTTISAAYTATVTLTATAKTGYKFVGWYEGSTEKSTKTTYSYPATNSTKTITAKFEELPKDVEFQDPSKLEIGKTYGKLSYILTMPQNRWYWIVLPYNVNVDSITTSTGGGWKDLVFTEYDAKRRANGENGWINWKEYGEAKPTQLTANKGYVIGPKDGPFDQDGVFIVTFPSASATNTVADSVNLATTEATGENEKDNNWHIIGTGLYHNASLKDINYVALPAVVNGKDSYEYKYITSSKEPFFTNPIGTNSFAPFTAFFVQHGGTYSAEETAATTSAELAPVARAKAQEQEQIYLINMNEARTVVILNAEGSEGYTAGEDFLEMNGKGINLIYSFDGNDALAFNHRAPEAQSIALGGYVATAGEQTISLNAYNGNAEAVTLIDNLTGETVDLLVDNYTFNAEVGSLDGRFTVVFAAQKAGDTTVDCYNSVANQVIAYGTADHCTVSGLTAGEAIVVYNTMGQLVFASIADSETITLPSLTAGNYLILHNGTTNKVALR